VEGRAVCEFILAATARSYYFLRRITPTNILIDAINTRRGLTWGVPAMLLAVPYRFAAAYFAGLVEAGDSGWLSVLVLLFVWDAVKFLVVGPMTLMRLIAVRVREVKAHRGLARALVHENARVERVNEPDRPAKHR
jgi:heme exporter protein D